MKVFFQSLKLTRREFLAGAVLLFACLLYSTTRPPQRLDVYPAGQGVSRSFYVYNDSDNGGTSFSEIFEGDSSISWYYEQKGELSFPYTGFGVELAVSKKDSLPDFLDLSGYDSLVFDIKSSSSEILKVQFLNYDPLHTRFGDVMSFRFLLQPFPVQKAFSRQSLALDDFSIPSWWLDQSKGVGDVKEKHMKRAWHLEFTSTNKLAKNVPDTVVLRRIYFIGGNDHLLWVWSFALVLSLAYLFRKGSRSHLQARIRQESMREVRKEQALESGEKLPIESGRQRESALLIRFLAEHYADPGLSLEVVTHSTGLNRNKVSALLREELGTSFKSHLNDLRLQEATRHLRESDLQVSEIAYKVGYRNVPHFGRLFKNKFEMSPNEFRRQNGIS